MISFFAVSSLLLASASDSPSAGSDPKSVIFTALAAVAAGLITDAWVKLRKKWKLDGAEKFDKTVQDAALAAVLYAEEAAWAEGKKLAGNKMSGEQKLYLASTVLKNKVPQLSIFEAEKRVMTALSKLRNGKD